MSAHLYVMRETNLRNIPATLRALADAIEANEYGPTTACAVVWQADELEISYTGEGEAVPNTVFLMHAALHKMVSQG